MEADKSPKAYTDPTRGPISDLEITSGLRLLASLLADPELYNALTYLLRIGFTPEEYGRACQIPPPKG